MQPDRHQIAVFDDRPFFERALVYGVRSGIIDQEKISSILNDAPKGMVQIAEYFGTQYLRPNIEEARLRIVNLVSLFLEDSSGGDLEKAARSLRDNTFLSHSRGGSELLKSLWAMPEDESYGILVRQSQKEFLADWSLRSLADYRQARALREGHQVVISAALWFAEKLGMSASGVSTVSVESIIRTAMLVYLSATTPASIPNSAGLIGMFGAIRQKGIPAKGRKRLQEILRALPSASLAVAQRELKKVEAEDLPRILDASLPMNRLIQELEPLYFLRDFGPEDASLFDAAVSEDWQRLTGGKTDDGSLLTMFVCLAADLPPKPALSKAAARALIRKARIDGFKRLPVLGFIRAYAPYEMQDDLEALWKEFFPEAQGILRDAADTTLGDAVKFLKENCIIV
jgi:hypothetical protein